MYSLSGFMTMNNLVDNTVGQVSIIGELSAIASSYSREKGFYANSAQPDVKLISFNSTQDDDLIPVPIEVVDVVLRLGQWLYQNSVNGTLTSDNAVALQTVTAAFNDVIDIKSMGKMVTNGTYWLPENIRFTIRAQSENVIRLWFSDPAFRRQYDLDTIHPIMLTEDPDEWFGPTASVQAMFDNISITEQYAKATEVRGDYPETDIISSDYDWHDPNGSGLILPFPFPVMIWGEAGRNLDKIKDAIIEEILSKSEHTRDEWAEVFPDLFTPTEFIIAPYWTQYAVPNNSLQAGIYSPFQTYRGAVDWIKQVAPGYDEEHIKNCLVMTGTIYKSLAIAVVGNVKNRHAPVYFESHQPEYMIVSTTSNDYGRVSEKGRQFIDLLLSLLVVAEAADQYSGLPAGITRTVRDGVMYICGTLEKVQYLVVAKSRYYSEDS